MKKSISIISKNATNKKAKNKGPNTSINLNINNYQTNNSFLSSITSPSIISRKTTETNRILSPIVNYKNKKKQNLNNYKYKNMQTFSPNNNKNNYSSEQTKNIKKTFLGKNKENEIISEKSPKNNKIKKDNHNILNNSRQNTAPLGKLIINKKIKNNEIKEIPGLKELDNEIMKEYDINKKDVSLNRDINLDKAIFDKSNEFNYFKIDNEKELTPFQKKEQIIQKLLRTKNYISSTAPPGCRRWRRL